MALIFDSAAPMAIRNEFTDQADVIPILFTNVANGPNQLRADSSFISLDALNFMEEQTQFFGFTGIIQRVDHVIVGRRVVCRRLAKVVKIQHQLGKFREVKSARSVPAAISIRIKVDRREYPACHTGLQSSIESKTFWLSECTGKEI